MPKLLTFSLLFFLSLDASSQGVQHYYSLAKEAYQRKNFDDYYLNLKQANKLHPYHQVILYQLGAAAALTHRNEEAFLQLKQAILIDATFKLKDNPDLVNIKDTQEFNDLLKFQAELNKPIIHSDTAMVLKDRTLHIEGIAYNPADNNFYIGSIHHRKIIRANGKGEVSDFCPPAAEGMTSVFGVKVNVKRNTLWVCSSPMPEMINYDTLQRSAVFKFELSTGKLLQKFGIDSKQPDGVFGDLILSKKGDVLISDSKKNSIYKVNEKTGQLDTFFTSEEFWSIQGMAFSANENYLFISDYIKGIFRLDLSTRELMALSNPPTTSLKGVDGLYSYKNGLITIQNGVTPARVTYYTLNEDLTSIDNYKILDRAHPAFNEPTLGVVINESFYYIANSQWSGYENGKQKPVGQLQDIVILKARLN